MVVDILLLWTLYIADAAAGETRTALCIVSRVSKL
jgi:hypothetical protein